MLRCSLQIPHVGYWPGEPKAPWRRTMWHAWLEVINEVTMRIILLRVVTKCFSRGYLSPP